MRKVAQLRVAPVVQVTQTVNKPGLHTVSITDQQNKHCRFTISASRWHRSKNHLMKRLAYWVITTFRFTYANLFFTLLRYLTFSRTHTKFRREILLEICCIPSRLLTSSCGTVMLAFHLLFIFQCYQLKQFTSDYV